MEDFNFNDPLEVTEVFRSAKIMTLPTKEEEEEEYQPEEDNKFTKPVEVKEFAFKHTLGWEDIKSVKEYMYPDDWRENRGPKYYLKVDYQQEEILVLGNYKSMTEHWRQFRNKYPLFKQD